MNQDFTIIFPTPKRHQSIHFQISECFLACKILHAITSIQIMIQDFTIIFPTLNKHQNIHFQISECFMASKILHTITSTQIMNQDFTIIFTLQRDIKASISKSWNAFWHAKFFMPLHLLHIKSNRLKKNLITVNQSSTAKI